MGHLQKQDGKESGDITCVPQTLSVAAALGWSDIRSFAEEMCTGLVGRPQEHSQEPRWVWASALSHRLQAGRIYLLPPQASASVP